MSIELPNDPELRELYTAVDLQLAVEAFLKTSVGKYLLLRAAMDRTDAMASLVDAPANDSERIRELQSTIKRADSIEMWLQEAIENGRHAQKQLDPTYQRQGEGEE